MEPRNFRPYEPDQLLLLPPSLKEWLSPNHLVYFMIDVVKTLNLSKIVTAYGSSVRGTVPFDPHMMVGILLYAYCVGSPSSRRIARKLEEDVAFRVLSAGHRPDFRTISEFRRRHVEALKELFLDVLKLCRKAGLIKLGHVSLDGTKIKANASKHKAMSYERMAKEEARLQSEIEKLLQEAEEIDQKEDTKYGTDKRGDELPDELAFRESRLKKIREAKELLEQEAREAASASGKEHPEEAIPAKKTQKNFTDSESRIMPSSSDKGSFVQGYNAQAVVDDQKQIIVAADVTQQANDKRQSTPMLTSTKENMGHAPKKASMDAGYCSEENITDAIELEIEPFIATKRQKHGEVPKMSSRGRTPANLSAVERMRRKLKTKCGQAVYGERKKIVEPVFGQIKHARGFRQFLLRGLNNVKGEWSLICTTHNLLKLWNAKRHAYG